MSLPGVMSFLVLVLLSGEFLLVLGARENNQIINVAACALYVLEGRGRDARVLFQRVPPHVL
jgi:hypothetical protein